MIECARSWRKKLRLQKLVDIAKNQLESGTEMNQICEILDEEMQSRWKLVPCTRKQYLETVKKILAHQYVLVM